MKKYFTSIAGIDKQNEIEFSESGNAVFNGFRLNYEYKFFSDNALVLRINNENYFLTFSESEENNEVEITLESRHYKIACKSDLDILIDKMSVNKSDTKVKKQIKSPMPGVIKSLNISKGQHVKKGEVLLVLEAMKMENEIRAVTDGVVKKVNVKEMSSVEKNEMLFEFE